MSDDRAYTEHLIAKMQPVTVGPAAINGNGHSHANGHGHGNGHTAEPAANVGGFSFITLAQLYERPDPVHAFVVDDLLPVGGSSILVAKPKVGKSTLAQQMARAVAGGSPFLDRGTQQGAVLYLGFEEKDTEVKASFKRAGAPAEMPVIFHFGDVPDDRMRGLRLAIEVYRPALVVVDTLAYWMGVVDFNDYGQVGAAMRPLHLLARATDTHIMTVHHAGKGSIGSIDSPLGSTALTGNVDTVLWLQEIDGGNRTVETRQRYGPQMPKTVLSFERETRMLTMAGTVSEVHRQAMRRSVLTLLQGRTMTETDLRETLQAQRNDVLALLNEMVRVKELVRTGRGQKGSPYMYELPACAEGQNAVPA